MTDTKIPQQALKNLIRGYVNLLETGRDRIIAAGRYCDPVDKMESADPYLREARSALAQQAEQGWQPISTAPKDGAEVLLGEPDGSITVAYWNEPKVEFTTDGGYDAPWATHWMPLPSAPKGVV